MELASFFRGDVIDVHEASANVQHVADVMARRRRVSQVLM